MTTSSRIIEETPRIKIRNDGYQCNICMAVFASKRTCNYHVERCILKEKICCDICGVSLNSNMALMVHKKFHVWEKDAAKKQQHSPVYECSVCDVRIRSPRTLVFHYREVHPYYDRFSSTGTKTFQRKSIPPLVYDENQNEIVTYADFECDLLVNKVKCPLCYMFYGENRIKGHFLTEHPFQKSIFCTHCAAIILDKQKMMVHLLEHTRGSDLHKCDVCDCYFVSTEVLTTHQHLHTSHRPFSCSVCQKEFQSKTAAIAHFHSHLKIEMLRDTINEAAPQKDGHTGMPETDDSRQ